MDKNVQVEILLATYNGGKYLKEQLESIVKQTYTNWVLKIRDDGSNDETQQIIEQYRCKYPDKILQIETKCHKSGAKYNFWELIKHSDGECLMCCDQDDVWHKDKIEVTLEKFKTANTDCPVLVYTDLRVVDEQLQLMSDSFQAFSGIDGKRNSTNYLLCENVVTGCTMMFNGKLRDVAIQVQDIENMKMHDHWLALVASTMGTIEYLESTTIEYRQHSDNSVGARSVSKVLKIKYILEEIHNFGCIMDGYINQADLFYESYKDTLLDEPKKLLENFKNIKKRNKLGRIFILIKYSIYKKNLVKMFGLFIAV